MLRLVFNRSGKFLREEEATPKCGEDFCDTCGDCLECYGEDSCLGSTHLWAVYEKEIFVGPPDRIETAKEIMGL